MTTRVAEGRGLRLLLLGASLVLVHGCSPPGPHEIALTEAIRQRNVEAAQRVIATGVNFGARVEQNTTLPRFIVGEMLASPRESAPLEQIGAAMFAAGADPNLWIPNRQRSIPLIERAAETGSAVLIEAMIKAGLDMKGQGAGRALVTASGLGYVAVVERLVAAGADVNYHWWDAGTIGCLTPLSEAVQGRHTAVIDLLERAGAKEW